MAKLGTVITEAIVLEYGRDEFLRRLSHPFWFQSFGAVMGMDWHSSGITTSVMGALKRGFAPLESELGLYVCGGRGRHSRKTPEELRAVGSRTGIDGDSLAHTSRLVAKVDSAAVNDGYDIYLHSFIVAADGKWAVIQQGMAPASRTARRYHWLSEGLQSFVDAPHSAIEGENMGLISNLTDRRAHQNREAQLALVNSGPDRALASYAEARPAKKPRQATLPHLSLPAHHEVLAGDVVMRRLYAALAAAADRGPKDFAELLMVPGVGARTVETLALVSEVIHGAPYRFSDPARFSYALGGKDGHPFPVPLRVYDRTLGVLRQAVDRAKLQQSDKLHALKRLDQQARVLDGVALGQPLEVILKRERSLSHLYGGRTVFGDRKPRPGRG